jgi:putative ABC transport system permease protein
MPDLRERPAAASHLIAKSVRHGRTRALVAVAGIAVSTLLVLVLMAAYRSLTHGVRAYAGSTRVDLWVAPLGTDNLIRSSALLPRSIVDSIATLPGVREAGPLVRGFVSVRSSFSARVHATEPTGQGPRNAINLLGLGYLAPQGPGGPPLILSGRPPDGPGEVMLDRAAAHRLRVSEGDTVIVNSLPFELVGLSAGTNLLATQFAFFDEQALEVTSGLLGQCSFVAVGLDSGQDADRLARQIVLRFPGIAAYTRDEFVENNIREVAAGFRPMQLLVSGMGVLAAAVLVALLVHGGVEDRRQDLAVLLAMGASVRSIAFGLVVHATLLVIIGGIVGGGVMLLFNDALLSWLPTLELAPRFLDLALALPLFTLVSGLAASVPLARLRRIDPITAFRP